jgi:outer membrane murein-binding lipoprotein Lpp
MDMKLAEALVLRADIQKRVEALRGRLRQSALVQEGEKPPEDPQELLAELDRLLNQLAGLIERINRSNLQTALPDGRTVTAALAQRDAIALRQSILHSLAETAAGTVNRYSRAEIKQVATVDVAALRKQVDQLAQQRRELDTAIQATNWAADLIE